jgi:DNA-binding NarL/FixJ family response regulator
LPDARFAGRDPKSLPEQSSYVRKDRLSQPGLLAEALDAVLQGSSERILRDDQDPARPLSSLTRTQIQVLRMIAQGMSNQQIADARNTSVQAVVRTISRAMQAIGATSDIEGNARVTAARNYMETAGIPSVE